MCLKHWFSLTGHFCIGIRHVYKYIYVYIYTFICIYIQSNLVSRDLCINKRMYLYIDLGKLEMYINIYINTGCRIPIFLHRSQAMHNIYIYMNINAYIHIHIYIYIYIHTHSYLYTYNQI